MSPSDPADVPGRPDGAIDIAFRLESAAELRALRGALLAARASELSEVQRRALRLNLGYGTDSARDSMSDEVADLRRRWEMLDRLLGAIDEAVAADAAAAAGESPATTGGPPDGPATLRR